MMTKKLVIRAILNCNEDVFRDIAISGSETLEELHLQISKAYELDSGQMASFYKTDDNWVQLEEIPLMSMDPKTNDSMKDYSCEKVLGGSGARLIFVYDFLAMWTFMIEFIRSSDEIINKPEVVLKYGERPENAPDPEFEGHGGTMSGEDNEEDEYGYDEGDLNNGFSSEPY